MARLVATDTVHHVTARGVNRCRIFRSAADYDCYLEMLNKIAGEEGVEIHGYVLMPNHVHLALTPTTPDGLARLFRRAHTRWAMHFNRKYKRSGHLFQGRYHSSPMDEPHFWTALRYMEVNPCKAGLVSEPIEWRWSSAHAHCTGTPDSLVHLKPVKTLRRFGPEDWTIFLAGFDKERENQIEQALRGSRPCGSPEWIKDICRRFKRIRPHLALKTARPAA